MKPISKAFWVLTFAAFALCAESFESTTTYKVGYGIFTFGEATASLSIDDQGNYKTKVSAKAKGVAATLSSNRVESYSSEGVVVNGRLVPSHFEKYSSHGKKKRHIEYFWDYENSQVVKESEVCDAKGCKQSGESLPSEEYVAEDILTLYHNIMFDFNKTGVKEMTVAAIGSKKPVSILVPSGDRLKTAKKIFDDKEGIYLVVILNQEIFTSSEGELYVNVDDDQTAVKAVLKKTMLFGDVWGEQTDKKISGTRALNTNNAIESE